MGDEKSLYPESIYCSKTTEVSNNGFGCTAKALSNSNYFKDLKW